MKITQKTSYFSRAIHAGRKNFCLNFRLVLRFPFAKKSSHSAAQR